MGDAPQALINSQLLDRADIVIGLFGSRLGSPTSSAVSGTVEEIERANSGGKPVHLYFSMALLPPDVDLAQLEGLRDFKKAVQDRGLYGEYHNTSELNAEIWKAIEHDLSTLALASPSPAGVQSDPVSFRVQNRSLGNQHYVDIFNRSATTDAENVRVEQEGEWPGRVLPSWSDSTTIHAEQTRSVQVAYFLGHAQSQPAIRITWDSEGESHQKVFYID